MRDQFEKEKAAFSSQRHGAMKRGIMFEMTFPEWLGWWERQLGPHWLKKRGRKRGQYVMARFGDTGPYKLSNIKCILCTENISEGGGSAKIAPDVVVKIYKAVGCLLYISKQFGVPKTAVFDIRHDRAWAKLTRELGKGKGCACQRVGINARKCPLV